MFALKTSAAVVLPPEPTPRIKLSWDYPVEQITPDLVFSIYQCTNLSVPISQWKVMTNVAGTETSVMLPKVNGMQFFAITASNFLGESSFGTVSH